MPANVFVVGQELGAELGREGAALLEVETGTGANRIAEALVRPRVHARDGAGADQADAETHDAARTTDARRPAA